MHVVAVLNRDGGTLKTTDLDAYCQHLSQEFGGAGYDISCWVVRGRKIIETLEAVGRDKEVEMILAGGGDGTVSAAASVAYKSGKPLGVIPAGTMNLFARSLGIPLDIELAATALANGNIEDCDIATANDRPFVHQMSVGLQPRMVRLRNAQKFHSRFGKILASLRASFGMFDHPPAFDVRLDLDEKEGETQKLSAISVSNNPYGEGHLPYADNLQSGKLGVYWSPPLDSGSTMKLVSDVVLGSWGANEDLHEATATAVRLQFPNLKKSARAVIDGEIIRLAPEVEIRIRPGALKVLRPAG